MKDRRLSVDQEDEFQSQYPNQEIMAFSERDAPISIINNSKKVNLKIIVISISFGFLLGLFIHNYFDGNTNKTINPKSPQSDIQIYANQKKPNSQQTPKDDSPKIIQQQQIQNLKPQQPQFTPFVPTLGVPFLSKPWNGTVVASNDLLSFQTTMDELFKPFNDTNCEFARFGDARDGGYVMCRNFVSQAKALINFGVEGRDNFGCSLTTDFQMPNFQYDCTNNRAPFCGSNNKNNHFNYVCISDHQQNKNGRNFQSIRDIIDKHDLKGKHIIMKIDIEGGQWKGFKSLPIDYLQYIDQIIFEVHNTGRGIPMNSQWGNLQIIQSMMQYFVNINLQMNNNACYKRLNQMHRFNAFAFEVTLVNKKLITINSNTRSYKQNYLNTKNAMSFADCQMTD